MNTLTSNGIRVPNPAAYRVTRGVREISSKIGGSYLTAEVFVVTTPFNEEHFVSMSKRACTCPFNQLTGRCSHVAAVEMRT
ncbi:MAG TPA: SWIM zinc finger family protein [Pyrinomonadaceae bacterium]